VWDSERLWQLVGWVAEPENPDLVAMTEPRGLAIVELGALTFDGRDTGHGNLARALGHDGPERVGSTWSLTDGAGIVHATLVGHAYGRGGDGLTSSPEVAIGILHPRYGDVAKGLGIDVTHDRGRLYIRRGIWRQGQSVPKVSVRGQRALRQPRMAGGAGSKDPPDHSAKVQHSGATAGWGGSYQAQASQHLANLAAHRPPWW
jgi:hypothetical protein